MHKIKKGTEDKYICLETTRYKKWFFELVKANEIEIICKKLFLSTRNLNIKKKIDKLYQFVFSMQKGIYGSEENAEMWAYILLQAIYNKIYSKKFAMTYLRNKYLKKYMKFKKRKIKRKIKSLFSVEITKKGNVRYRGLKGKYTTKKKFTYSLKKFLKNVK